MYATNAVGYLGDRSRTNAIGVVEEYSGPNALGYLGNRSVTNAIGIIEEDRSKYASKRWPRRPRLGANPAYPSAGPMQGIDVNIVIGSMALAISTICLVALVALGTLMLSASGRQGPRGPAGSDGEKGSTGPAGPSGSDGADCTDGTQGEKGDPGNGTCGFFGPSTDNHIARFNGTGGLLQDSTVSLTDDGHIVIPGPSSLGDSNSTDFSYANLDSLEFSLTDSINGVSNTFFTVNGTRLTWRDTGQTSGFDFSVYSNRAEFGQDVILGVNDPVGGSLFESKTRVGFTTGDTERNLTTDNILRSHIYRTNNFTTMYVPTASDITAALPFTDTTGVTWKFLIHNDSPYSLTLGANTGCTIRGRFGGATGVMPANSLAFVIAHKQNVTDYVFYMVMTTAS